MCFVRNPESPALLNIFAHGRDLSYMNLPLIKDVQGLQNKLFLFSYGQHFIGLSKYLTIDGRAMNAPLYSEAG